MPQDDPRDFYVPSLPATTATQYALDVKNGKIVAGPLVRAACERHLQDLERQTGEFWFDEEMEEYVVEFIETQLFLFKGRYSGRPFLLFPWARFVVGCLFGWHKINRHGEAVRRFNSAYIETGKGSAKSPLAMALALYMLVADGEEQSEVYVFARNVPQARIPFNMAWHMVRMSPLLRENCRIRGGDDPHTIKYRDSVMERLASDARGEGKSGHMPHFIAADEFHEQASIAMLNRMEAGIKSRDQPMSFLITNSGAGIVNNHCWERHQYAEEVVTGTREDDQFFGYVCTLDRGDKPFKDESCWEKVNPALPWIPGYDYIRGEVKKAAGLPSKRSEVERLNFCIWTEAESPWIDRDAWLDCEVDELSPEEDRKDKKCFICLDLANKNDLTAGGAVWDMEDGTFELECVPWVPTAEIQRLDDLMPEPVLEWVRLGHLRKAGKVQDFSQVAEWINEMRKKWNVVAIGYDKRFIDQLIFHLEEKGVPVEKAPNCVVEDIHAEKIPVLAHPQGTQAPSVAENAIKICMHSSIEAFENKILNGNLKAKVNPLLRSGVLGAVIAQDQADNRRFLKQNAKVKIDTAVASAMAVGLAAAWREPERPGWIVLPIYD